MEEIEQPMPPVSEVPVPPLPQPPQASASSPMLDPAITESINRLEKQVIASMDLIVEQLQSLQQAGSLDKVTLNGKIHEVLGLAQASLLISTLPLLLAPPTVKVTLQTAELFKKVYTIAETLKTLWKEQTTQAIDSKALKILGQIKAKEQQIKQQIAKKQEAIAEIIRSKGSVHITVSN